MSKNKENLNNKKVPIYKNFYIMSMVIMVLITFLFNLKYKLVFVSGSSMEPTFYDKDFALAEKNTNLDRFDIVIIITEEPKMIIKRVIGLPGETIEYKNNQLYINNKLIKENYSKGNTEDFSITLNKNCYYCLGDNRENSLDSRYYGEFNRNQIMAEIIKGGGK